MAEQADARRMRLLQLLSESEEPLDLDALGTQMRCDPRTIRRDLDFLQRLLQTVEGVEVRRNKVLVARSGWSPGYFTDQLSRNQQAKDAIARAIVASLPDEIAVALTAGSTPYAVARELRRSVVETDSPRNLIVFTNSIPSLLELVAAGISAGVLGEIYSPEDCAFHTPDFHSAFQPGIAIVGASGVLFNISAPQATLDLFSHRAEEAAFLKQLLAEVPEIVVAVDSTKLGKHHPWSFGGSVLYGKTVRLITDTLSEAQREQLSELGTRLTRHGITFTFDSVSSSPQILSFSIDNMSK